MTAEETVRRMAERAMGSHRLSPHDLAKAVGCGDTTVRRLLNEDITSYLNERLTEEYGIHVSSALVIDVQLDSALQQKVQAKEQAKQDAEIAELEKQTAQAQAETDKVIAESEAQVKVIEAQAEAQANQIISQSITPELIQMKEAEARLEHGWVTVQGADTIVSNHG